jgi:hypothetical protein
MNTLHCGDIKCSNVKISERSHNRNYNIAKEDPNFPWQLPQSGAYIGPNLRATCGKKIGIGLVLIPRRNKSMKEGPVV